jgi:hypothetical protein
MNEGVNYESIKIVRHGQSCTNIMGQAYALLIKGKNPYDEYGENKLGPPKTQPLAWSYLSNISQDPPLHNGGLYDLLKLYENNYKDLPQPDKVYCSSMCRAIQTALILYPNGGVDGKIHICPWIHEQPHSSFLDLEKKLTGSARAPRNYDELLDLIVNIENIYKSGDINVIKEVLGNGYISEILRLHNITADLEIHNTLENNYDDDPNIERFVEEILKDDTDKKISIVSHGYTMLSGCKSKEADISGWCKYFESISNETDVDNECFKSPCIDLEIGEQVKSNEPKLMTGTYDIRPSTILPCETCDNSYLDKIRSHKNISNGDYIEFKYDDEKERKTLNYVNLENSNSVDNQLKRLCKYHFEKEGSSESVLNCMKILMRNLIFPWAYFAVGEKSYCNEQKLILESEGGFCDRTKLEDGNNSLPDYLGELDTEEFKLFPPILYAQIPTTGSKKFKKKKKTKRKKITKRKKSKYKKSAKKKKRKSKKKSKRK